MLQGASAALLSRLISGYHVTAVCVSIGVEAQGSQVMELCNVSTTVLLDQKIAHTYKYTQAYKYMPDSMTC